ncbi:hypothetical protein TNCV_663151 [Trichonephila clavipes]|nr:hypothetical protein TNCV_663151 [Trichonephila clavipes]
MEIHWRNVRRVWWTDYAEPKHLLCLFYQSVANVLGWSTKVGGRVPFGGVKRRIHQIPSVVNNNRADVKITVVTLGTGDLPSLLNIKHNDEAHVWLNGYVNKQNCRIWSEANPQVYVETPLHPEKLTVWCTLWAGGILLQKR